MIKYFLKVKRYVFIAFLMFLFDIMHGFSVLALDKLLYDRLFLTLDKKIFYVLIALNVMLLVFYIFTNYYRGVFSIQSGKRLEMLIKRDTLQKIQSYTYDFFTKHDSGFIIKRVNEDSAVVGSGIWTYFSITVSVLEIIFNVIVMNYVNNTFSLIYGTVSVVYFVWAILFKSRLGKFNDIEGDLTSSLYKQFWEVLGNIKEIKVLNLGFYAIEKYLDVTGKIGKNNFFKGITVRLTFFLNSLFPMMNYCIVVFYSIPRIQSGSMTVGEFMILLSFSYRFLNPVNTIISSYTNIVSLKSAYRRLEQIQNHTTENFSKNAKMDLAINRINVSIHEFSYSPAVPILHNIFFELHSNDKLAIIGKSGSGKSSIASLLIGLFRVSNGMITFNGLPIDEIPIEILRGRIAYVSQDKYLFKGSLKDNIDVNKNLSIEEITDICSMCCLDDVISRLPSGVYEYVWDIGMFSGGERQRICLARALAQNADVYILDEHTSALDQETAHRINTALYKYLHNKMIISITHKKQDVMLNDSYILMRNGTIAEHKSVHESHTSALFREHFLDDVQPV